MVISESQLVGELASHYPGTTRVFSRHGIDFCCGGGRPLADVCQEMGLDSANVIEELRAEIEKPAEDDVDWTLQPIADLIAHILDRFHQPLPGELDRLESMMNKVHQVHREKDPERLDKLQSLVVALKAELLDHMAKEEQVLFPMVLQGAGPMVAMPMEVMRSEHDQAGLALKSIRTLTDDFTPPEHACTTWKALWAGFADLEKEMHQHIHLENNILFPRVMGDVG